MLDEHSNSSEIQFAKKSEMEENSSGVKKSIFKDFSKFKRV